MSTQRQIDANRKNAELSTGPKTFEGKLVSRGNAIKHGLSGTGAVALREESEKLEKSLGEWRPCFQKELEGNSIEREFLFRQMVLNSIRMRTAQDREAAIHQAQKQHAFNNWESDRRLKAEALGSKIAKSPSLIVAKLRNFLQGCEWLIAQWTILRSMLQAGQPLDDKQISLLDDLLGIAPHLRFRDSTIEIADALSIVEGALERLEADRVDGLQTLDDQDRAAAEEGFEFEISQEERLNRRYEDLASRRFQATRKELKASRPEPIQQEPTPDDDFEPEMDEETSREVDEMIRRVRITQEEIMRNKANGSLANMERACGEVDNEERRGSQGGATTISRF